MVDCNSVKKKYYYQWGKMRHSSYELPFSKRNLCTRHLKDSSPILWEICSNNVVWETIPDSRSCVDETSVQLMSFCSRNIETRNQIYSCKFWNEYTEVLVYEDCMNQLTSNNLRKRNFRCVVVVWFEIKPKDVMSVHVEWNQHRGCSELAKWVALCYHT